MFKKNYPVWLLVVCTFFVSLPCFPMLQPYASPSPPMPVFPLPSSKPPSALEGKKALQHMDMQLQLALSNWFGEVYEEALYEQMSAETTAPPAPVPAPRFSPELTGSSSIKDCGWEWPYPATANNVRSCVSTNSNGDGSQSTQHIFFQNSTSFRAWLHEKIQKTPGVLDLSTSNECAWAMQDYEVFAAHMGILGLAWLKQQNPAPPNPEAAMLAVLWQASSHEKIILPILYFHLIHENQGIAVSCFKPNHPPAFTPDAMPFCQNRALGLGELCQ